MTEVVVMRLYEMNGWFWLGRQTRYKQRWSLVLQAARFCLKLYHYFNPVYIKVKCCIINYILHNTVDILVE